MTTTRTPRRTYTPDDLLRLRNSSKRYELVDGRLEVLSVSYLSSFVATTITVILRAFVNANRLGWVSSEGTSLQCFPQHPDRVRKPDSCFHKLERLSHDQATTQGHLTVAPDLVVEVISPHDRAVKVNQKLLEWRDAGVLLIWLVYPKQKLLYAHFSNGDVKEFRVGDTLTADPVMPGFAVPVAELFRLPA